MTNTAPQTALITGGSKGLGRALAEALVRRGARVALVARGAAELHATVEALRAEGGEAYGLVADVGAKDDIHQIAGQAADLLGPIDLLVHDASALGPTPLRAWMDTECEDLERVLAVNLVGPMRLTKAIAGPMLLRGQGTVLFISSDAAVNAYPRWGAYGASKAAADHLAATLAAELASSGVRVLSVDPGEMDTEMHAAAIPDADRGALARPADVARAIVALLDAGAADVAGPRVVVSTAEVSS